MGENFKFLGGYSPPPPAIRSYIVILSDLCNDIKKVLDNSRAIGTLRKFVYGLGKEKFVKLPCRVII